jgi:hypothetical protein
MRNETGNRRLNCKTKWQTHRYMWKRVLDTFFIHRMTSSIKKYIKSFIIFSQKIFIYLCENDIGKKELQLYFFSLRKDYKRFYVFFDWTCHTMNKESIGYVRQTSYRTTFYFQETNPQFMQLYFFSAGRRSSF